MGESTDHYVAALRELVKKCKFGTMENKMLRDDIVEKKKIGVFTATGAASSCKLVCVAGAIGVGERWYRFLRRVPLGVSTM